MRKFNDIEKAIIMRLSDKDIQPKFVHDFIIDILDNCLLKIQRDENRLDIVMFDEWDTQSIERQDKIVDLAYRVTNKIITVISFIKYLENEGYILTCYFAHGIAIDPTYGQEQIMKKFNEKDHKIINWPFTDIGIKQLILESIDLNILPTEELRAFAKNGFKTIDDIRFDKTIRIAWIAIGISIFLGLAGILMNILALL